MNINQLPSGNSWTLTYLFSEIHHVCYLLINSQKVNKIMIGNRWTKIWISNMYLFQYMYQPIRKSKIIVSKYVIGIDKLIWKKTTSYPDNQVWLKFAAFGIDFVHCEIVLKVMWRPQFFWGKSKKVLKECTTMTTCKETHILFGPSKKFFCKSR